MSRMHFVAVAALSALTAGAASANTTTSTVAVAETQATASEATAAEAKPEPAPAEPAKPVVVAEPDPTLIVRIDLSTQTMSVSSNGVPQYTWPISSGTASHPTPRGTFRPQWTAKMWYSRKYDLAPMPHAVFINGGVAVHGTGHVGALGRPASHGCIRLAPGNAKTFYNLVQRHGLRKTKVSVYGTPKWREPAVASRAVPNKYASNGGSSWFWGDWSDSNSAYSPNFINNKKNKKYAVPPSKFYGKKTAKRAKPYGYGSNW